MLDGLFERIGRTFTVSQVFGDPIERDGVTVVPVALIAAGGGGGSDGQSENGGAGGGGMGGQARAAGVYEIRGSEVRWRPAWDVNRLGIAAAVVTVVFLLTRLRR